MAQPTNPSFDIAHLGHVELFTDRMDESLDFFTRVYGLTLSGRQEGSAYLRAWDDYEFHTLKLTAHKTTGGGPYWLSCCLARGACAPCRGD